MSVMIPPRVQFHNAPNGFIYTYEAGTSTPLETYPTDNDAIYGTNANPNPVTLDARGEANVFLKPGGVYKIDVRDSSNVSLVGYPVDNIYDVGSFLNLWSGGTYSAIYLSANSIRFENIDRTSQINIGQRIKLIGGGNSYATVKSLSFSTHTDVVLENIMDSSGVGDTVDVALSSISLYKDPHEIVTNISNIAQLRAAGIFAETRIVYVQGYYSPGDGGGGTFYWDETSSDADDGGLTILPTGHTGTGRWKRQITPSTVLNIRWFGAVPDGATTKTDNTAFIQAALDVWDTATVQAITVYVPPGTYSVGNLILQSNTILMGDDFEHCSFICKSGTTGKWITDDGVSAQKIQLKNLSFYGNYEAGVTSGIELGTVGDPWGGGNASMYNIWVRDLPNATAMRLDTNVAYLYNIQILRCKNGFIASNANHNIFGISIVDCGADGDPATISLQTAAYDVIHGLEIEAPNTGSTIIKMERQAQIMSGLVALGNDAATHSEIVQINTAYVTTLGAITCNLIVSLGTSTYDKFYKDTSGNVINDIAQSLFSGADLYFGKFSLQQYLLQNFVLNITNDAGTIKHRIISPQTGTNQTGDYQERILNSTATLTTTPTGADASTAMAGGGKISSASTSTFIFDTNNQIGTTAGRKKAFMQVNFEFNSTGTALNVYPVKLTRDVNGVNIERLELVFTDAATGASYPLTSIPVGKSIIVNVIACLK